MPTPLHVAVLMAPENQGGSLMFTARKKSIVGILGAAAIMASLTITSGAGQAAAYSGSQAAYYADLWATARNSNFPNFGSDCTNFVSQAVNYGGFSMVEFGQAPSSPYSWWVRYSGGFTWSLSWSVAGSYFNFLSDDSPGGVNEGSATGEATNYFTPDSVVTGDVLFYDWGQGEGISHVTIQVGIGTDPTSGYYGNYVDEHTSDRYHAFWSLYPYNANAVTTNIYFMHVSANNT